MTCVHTITPGRAVAKINKQNMSLPERDGASTFNSDRKKSGKLACLFAGSCYGIFKMFNAFKLLRENMSTP